MCLPVAIALGILLVAVVLLAVMFTIMAARRRTDSARQHDLEAGVTDEGLSDDERFIRWIIDIGGTGDDECDVRQVPAGHSLL